VGSAEEGGLRGYHHRLAGVDRAEKGLSTILVFRWRSCLCFW
jgi:hypothetical protein